MSLHTNAVEPRLHPGSRRAPGELALLGGTPAFAEPLHVGRPNVGDRARLFERLGEALDRRWLTNVGPLTVEFEQRVADAAGARHGVAVCNATAGLELAARALDLTGEVVMPAFTFVAGAHAMQWLGLSPVFCDVDPRTHNLDPARVEAAITPRTTAILAVHVWGRPCPVDALGALARRRGLRLVYDAAHAFGCSAGRRGIGGFGDATVFSFHATKFVNAGEGGAIVTDDDALAARLRLMRGFGFTDYDTVSSLGINAKMSELAAAMGLTSLDAMDDFVTVNRRNHEAYARQLDGLPGLSLVRYDAADRPNYQYVVLEVDEAAAGLSRDELLQVLHAERVLARRYFYPGVHRMEPYRTLQPDAGRALPATERLAAHGARARARDPVPPARLDGAPRRLTVESGGGVEVSVILVTYNHERYVGQAIESVLAQEAPFAFELLVTEDCSTDGTRDVVRAYAARHPERIRTFLSERNLCSNEVFTRALRAARGRYVAVLDGDDYWTSPEKLRKQVDYLRAHPECSLCHHDVLVVPTGPAATTTEPRSFSQTRPPDIAGMPHILRDCFVGACSPLFRREAIAELPAWYDEAELADWALFIIAAQHGPFGYLHERLGAYRKHERGLWTGRNWTRKVDSFIRFNALLQQHLPESRPILRDLGATYQLWRALALEEAGDPAGARAAALTALRTSPFGERARTGQLLRLLARLAVPGLYARARRLRRAVGGRDGVERPTSSR
jgi:dTDP-4-amino-4,6-dideoxygalactose transaminase/glycosyltransferase involved in cell wall biosynthesis